MLSFQEVFLKLCLFSLYIYTGYFMSFNINQCERKFFLLLIIYDQLHILFSAELFDKVSRQLYFYLVRCVSKCKPGYTGLNCTRICSYSSYGERCQGYCECSNETCDISTGCRGLNTPTTGLYIFDVCFWIVLHTTMYSPNTFLL